MEWLLEFVRLIGFVVGRARTQEGNDNENEYHGSVMSVGSL